MLPKIYHRRIDCFITPIVAVRASCACLVPVAGRIAALRNYFRANYQIPARLTAMLLIACSAMLLSMPASAQSPISPAAGTTPEMLENRIKEAEAAVDLDETTRGALLELYRKASSQISQQRNQERIRAGTGTRATQGAGATRSGNHPAILA